MKSKIRLSKNHYGKSGVRFLRLDRSVTPHRLMEAEVDIRVEGHFETAYTQGDNSKVLPTDTMKNTVYALARQVDAPTIEHFGLALGEHLVNEHEAITRASVALEERAWGTIGDHPDAFSRVGEELATSRVIVDGGGRHVRAGLSDLTILKTTRSGFVGFPRDRYTTLAETEDRIFATRMTAVWDYRGADIEYASARQRARELLLETFAVHESRSVQHTLHAMGEAVLSQFESVWRIRLTMPNKHYLLADLAKIGLDNPNHIFVPTDEPYGNIEATLERT